MPINHTFVSPLADGPDPDQVQASHWNAAHDLSTLTWADFPESMRPVYGQLVTTGSITGSTSSAATKGVIFTADQDLDIYGVRFGKGAFTGDYVVGVARVLSLTESLGTITAATLDGPAAESPPIVTSGANAQEWEGVFASPVRVVAGEKFYVYSTVVTAGATGTTVNRATSAPNSYFRWGATIWPNGSGTLLFTQTPYTGGSPSTVGSPSAANFIVYPLVRLA